MRNIACFALFAVLAASAPATAQLVNADFETGTLFGWTTSSINGGIVLISTEGTCWSYFDTRGITLAGNHAANVRSSGPAPVSSVGILTSAPFIASGGVSFRALSERQYASQTNPVHFEVRLLILGVPVVTQVVTTNLITMTVACGPTLGPDAPFSTHYIDTSAFAGQSMQIEFRQHTNTPGAGFFTLVDDVAVFGITVPLDIKPGSFPNSINLKSNGTVPAAILSTALFSAATVDPATVLLAGAPVALKNNGSPHVSLEDVNGDGMPDLVLHFETKALQLTPTDTQAVLTGKTFSGAVIVATDSVNVVK